ncbi:MAG: Na+/H+ antiporter NhaC family protein [Kiritimatiellae bacterium]|nr:Na+/H+ antiporter NhaC family protein [Kiritimatiellia bacterium]
MKKLSVLAVALLACSALLAGDCAGTAGTWLSVLPPLVAIALTLATREVYSSIFAGILVGAAIATGFSFVETATTIVSGGFVKSLTDPSNAGILVFLVLLGAIVAMLNKTGASAAFGRWAQGNIRSRTGAQVATACLGLLIFIDDYFNCLAVGSVMRPVTDSKRVSRAKLAYLIDSTAAPICIIAPISSWAAAVAGFASGAGAESGLALFVKAIPYNFYAILTIVTMFMVALLKLDFGPMRKHELAVASGGSDPGAASGVEADGAPEGSRGKVCDLFIPMAVLAVACTLSLVYTGGFFGGKADGDFIRAFAEADASLGLAYGAFLGALFATAFYLSRRVISFRECMAAFPEGFRMMVPAIMILCFAWTLKNITDTLGAREFVSGLVQGSASSFLNFLPAVVFVVAAVLAFATGTSWGTFGVLIPIVLAAVPGSHLATISISACMAGAVCGDHASPISDTTVMASAGAQCNHVVHVRTQLPYVALVAGVSFAGYLVAPFTGSAAIALAAAVAMMLAALFALRAILRRRTN